MWKTFKEEHPEPKTWIKVLTNDNTIPDELYGVTSWEFFVEMNDGIAIFADTEKMENVFPAGEEGFTHWKSKNKLKDIDIVIDELKSLFDTDNDENFSRESKGKFYIHKGHIERLEVISKLENYFECIAVKDGYLSVDGMTFIYTTFEVCHGKPE